MPIRLRKHNEETYEKIKEGFKKSNKVAVVHPTGTGKSFLALKLLEENKGKRALYVAPSNAILHNLKKNIFESGMNMTDFPNLKRITYQKLMKLSKEDLEKMGVDIIIFDEFHHCGAPEWGAGVERLLEYNPDAQVLGLSATPIRYFDQSRDMAEEMFGGNVVSEMSLEDAINKGILPRAKYVSSIYEFSGELEKMQSEINKITNIDEKRKAQEMFDNMVKQVNASIENLPSLLEEYMTKKNGKYIVFCKDIEDMKKKMEEAQAMFGKVNPNIKTYSVSSKLTDNERTLRRFEEDNDENSLKLMFAVDMLNEGYHVKDLDGVVMMRPTYSPTIYAQQLGRALTVKTEDGKEPLIIDLVNNLDSIKIIEDLYEKLSKYEATGTKKREEKEQPPLRVIDKIKEFRDVAKKITQFTKRNIVPLKEKIETFERYFEEGNTELDGTTIFEGKPIGAWAITIRSLVKNESDSINLTEEQLQILTNYGVLERRIDSTLDEKIDAVVAWKGKYPKLPISKSSSKNKSISNKVKAQLEQIAADEGISYSEIEEKYRKIQSYYDYIKQREWKGKLSPEQILKCKDGNLGGSFGFSTQKDKIAERLNINVEYVDHIITKYGSIDNFIKLYRDGKIEPESFGMDLNSVIENVVDVDNSKYSKNYKYFVNDVCRGVFDTSGFHMISSKSIDEALNTLPEIEREILQLRYGLLDGKGMILDSIKEHYAEKNFSRERVRQREAKALRYVRHPSRNEKIIPISIDRLKDNIELIDEEREEVVQLENDMYDSNLLFRHESLEDTDFELSKLELIKQLSEKYGRRFKTRTQVEEERKQDKRLEDAFKRRKMRAILKESLEEDSEFQEDIDILRLLLSTNDRAMFGIEGIKTIADLVLWIEENKDSKSTQRIVSSNSERINDYLEKAKPIIDKRIKELEETNEKIYKGEDIPIEEIDFSVRTYKCLHRYGIMSMQQLASLSDEEILGIRNLGQKSFEEVKGQIESFRKQNELETDVDEKFVSIVDANLSISSYYTLKRAGINSINELARLSDEEICRIKVGSKSVLREILAKAEAFRTEKGIVLSDTLKDETSDKIENNQETLEESKTKNDSSKPSSKLEEIRARKGKLEAELESIEEQTRKAKELLSEYNELLGEDKTPDFKEE